jgi:hypothetical protein
MPVTNRFKVNHGDVFPHGAYLVSEVEPVRDFDKSSPGRPVQATDKETGLLMWSAVVVDADPDAPRNAKTLTVKFAAKHQPIPPEAPPGVPFRPVEFEDLTVIPYVQETAGRPRVAYSLRASGMRAPQVGGSARHTPRPTAGGSAAGSDAA